jgi:hypothetical protein
MSAPETPYVIHVPDDKIEALKRRLSDTILPDTLEDADWDYGPPLADFRRLIEYWKNGYDWRKHEAKMNELPNFSRDIDVDGHGTLNIHYIHQRSPVPDAIPLLFMHGCESTSFTVLCTRLIPWRRARELSRGYEDTSSSP